MTIVTVPESTRVFRDALAAFIADCTRFDGRYISRLSEGDRAVIHAASGRLADLERGFNGSVCSRSEPGCKPQFVIGPAVEELARVDAEIDEVRIIGGLPELQPYADALRAYRDATIALELAAERAGLVYGKAARRLSMPSDLSYACKAVGLMPDPSPAALAWGGTSR